MIGVLRLESFPSDRSSATSAGSASGSSTTVVTRQVGRPSRNARLSGKSATWYVSCTGNNGGWGGCWCMGLHVKVGKGRTPAQNRAEKEQRVLEGRIRAALAFDGDQCLGWCQFGSPDELPEVKSRRRYDRDLGASPDWRITCFFTGKGLRRRGVADAALAGALAEIARLGGGTVEGYPDETDDRSLSGSFLPHRADGRLREPRLHARVPDLPAPLGRHPHRRPDLRQHVAMKWGETELSSRSSCGA